MLEKTRAASVVILGGLLLPVVCAQDVPKKQQRKAKNAVETVARREIINAIDAGDGDVLTRELRRRVVEEPTNVAARLALANAYEKQGAPELAIDHYRIAAFEYGSEVAASRLGKALDGVGESDQAVEVLVRFCELHDRASSRILSELAILEDEMGNLSRGEHYHAKALTAALAEGAPNQDALHSNLGYNLIRQKRYAEAEMQLRTALALNSHSAVARNNLAQALAAGSNPNEAILQWQSLSGPAAAHSNLAAVYIDQGRYADARHELETALAFDKGNAAAFKNLETLSALDGKPAQVSVVRPPVAAAQAKTSLWKRWFARKGKNDRQPGEVAAVKN